MGAISDTVDRQQCKYDVIHLGTSQLHKLCARKRLHFEAITQTLYHTHLYTTNI